MLSKSFAGSSSSFTYNASGMLLSSAKTAGGLSEVIDLVYDGLGRVSTRTATVTPTTGSVTAYVQDFSYDNDNLPTTLSYSACQGGVCSSSASMVSTYDALGRKVGTSFPGAVQTGNMPPTRTVLWDVIMVVRRPAPRRSPCCISTNPMATWCSCPTIWRRSPIR
ncbi:MAG: hypothetical protein Q9M45_09170 [Robiginitomaculum sp.]|nr:hypothetical protein [Robiginitomaculum sp.]